MVSGPQTDKHLPESPFSGHFLGDGILHCLLSVVSFYGTRQIHIHPRTADDHGWSSCVCTVQVAKNRN